MCFIETKVKLTEDDRPLLCPSTDDTSCCIGRRTCCTGCGRTGCSLSFWLPHYENASSCTYILSMVDFWFELVATSNSHPNETSNCYWMRVALAKFIINYKRLINNWQNKMAYFLTKYLVANSISKASRSLKYSGDSVLMYVGNWWRIELEYALLMFKYFPEN